ncbi:6-hydroxymethylpterin diphosphokinase MptE-like protein [Dethiosulfovibrio salsuginis]|uniref:Uncharacterized conserved protein n=1 Tax=Dethiosulfovibrio salsuginis TaxID=561720 RepID=A0A1X7IU27_9BACT|nr:6-hydroxymethylpterin diphosphokinase MptE-like protein [Dethiosulfovibrio salsuginis]SMG18631.1 Uncharacterized conserved protein [Dethiosulfovibrio salsuginis]
MIEEKLNPILVANLKALDERQPLFAQKVRDYMKNAKDRFSINARETPRGTWWSGLYEQPFFEPNSCLDATPEGTKPVLIMAGLGSPRYLTGILNNSKKRQTIVLLEPNMRMMMFALESIPFFVEGHPSNVYFMLGSEQTLIDELISQAYANRGTFVGGVLDVHSHPGEVEQASETFNASLRFYVQRIRYRMQTLGDSAEDTLLGVRQMAMAAPWIMFRERLEPLKNAFKGYHGVVLSAGPSLDKNIHLLKGMEDKLVIVAADTLLNKLSEMGIRPHFVCALERGEPTYTKYFRPMYDREDPSLKDIVLVVQSVCYPQIAGRWPGKLCVVGKESINLDREVIAGALGGSVLPSGSSVAHMAMGILSFLGVDRIALVGQDLAFGPGKVTHAGGTPWIEEKSGAELEQPISIPGALGGMVDSIVPWKLFVDTFEEMIPKISCSVWDCTEGGALIRGTEIRPLSEYLAGIDISVDNSFDRVNSGVGFAPKDRDIAEVEKKLNSIEGMFKESLDFIEEGKTLMDDLEEAIEATGEFPHQMASRMTNLLCDLSKKNPFLGYVGQSYVAILIADQSRLSLSDEDERSTWFKVHREFFQAHGIAATVFLDWIRYMRASSTLSDFFNSSNIQFPPDEEAIQAQLEPLLKKEQEEGLTIVESVMVDFLLSRVDPVSAKWSPWVLWAIGRHLHQEGRYVEASFSYQAAIEGFEGSQMGLDAATALLKDRARSLMGRDLCWIGNPQAALESLANAYSYTPEDPEIVYMLERLLERRKVDTEDMLIKQTDPDNIKYFQAMVSALEKELERLNSDTDRADVIERYLVKILQEKSSSPIDGDPIKEVGEGD